MKQLGLFAPPLARRTDPPQSHRAAEEIEPELTGLRLQTLRWIADHPGLTLREIADEENLRDPRTANRRAPEIREHGLVRALPTRPCSATNRHAAPYEITEAGRIALAAGEVSAVALKEAADHAEN